MTRLEQAIVGKTNPEPWVVVRSMNNFATDSFSAVRVSNLGYIYIHIY